jgi:hypothetical protein
MIFEEPGKLCNDDFVEGCLSSVCVNGLPTCLISTTTKTLRVSCRVPKVRSLHSLAKRGIPLCFQRMFLTRCMPKYLIPSMKFKFVYYVARHA